MARGPVGGGSRPFWPRARAVATVNACGRAVERSPWLAREAVEQGHEVSCHGWRWERHAGMSEAVERRAIAKTVAAIREATGVAPVGLAYKVGAVGQHKAAAHGARRVPV